MKVLSISKLLALPDHSFLSSLILCIIFCWLCVDLFYRYLLSGPSCLPLVINFPSCSLIVFCTRVCYVIIFSFVRAVRDCLCWMLEMVVIRVTAPSQGLYTLADNFSTLSNSSLRQETPHSTSGRRRPTGLLEENERSLLNLATF